MTSNEFYGALGVIGEKTEGALGDMLSMSGIRPTEIYSYKNAAFFISRNQIIEYPPSFDINNKSLMLFGNFFLKDVPLDKFLGSPHEHLKTVMTGDNLDGVPLKFVNGSYVGILRREKSYVIFNDFFGLQPLYYYHKNGSCVISTSLKVLNKYVNAEPDMDTLNEYLSLGTVISYRTIRKNIRCLPPASKLAINENGEIRIESYTTYGPDPLVEDTLENIAEHITAEFKTAIKRIYSNKLKYCLNLTGGADTRLIFFEWPDRHGLLTETAGAPDSSDVLKAMELVDTCGNPALHALENLEEEKYLDGFKSYYELCDNPLNVRQNFNLHHLQWKISRSADIRIFGAGELLGGENLYLSRSPLYLLREGILPYRYHRLEEADGLSVIKDVLKAQYKLGLNNLLREDLRRGVISHNELDTMEKYLGCPKYKETFTERFRTYITALGNYLPFIEVLENESIFVSPYFDRELVSAIIKYHPKYRELRRLQFYILKKYYGKCPVPLDTTHLPLTLPYYFHKLFRVPRFILNVGFHKRVPFIQKGNPPLERIDPYLIPANKEFRDYIKATIFANDIFDKKSLEAFFRKVEATKKFNFFTHHKEITNLYLLFRMTCAIKL